jgi:hyperosmotically inducible protein
MCTRLLRLGLASGLAVALAGGAPAVRAQQSNASSAKQSIEKAGEEAKDAARSAGQATKDAAKSVAQATEDSTITTKIKAKIFAHSAREAGDVHVTTTDNVVTLDGTVESEAARKRIIGDANHTDGVERVDDRLKVSPSR